MLAANILKGLDPTVAFIVPMKRVEIDGMGTVEGVVIISATNRADLLDKVL